MLAEKNEFIKQSIVTLQELTADEKAKMQMEARERYRRDLAASVELGKQASKEVIQSLNNTVNAQKNVIDEQQNTIGEQQTTINEQQNTIQQTQSENQKLQEENQKKDERIRFLEAQLAQTDKQDNK